MSADLAALPGVQLSGNPSWDVPDARGEVWGWNTAVGHSIAALIPEPEEFWIHGNQGKCCHAGQVEPCSGGASRTNPRSGVGTDPDPALDHQEVPWELPGPRTACSGSFWD